MGWVWGLDRAVNNLMNNETPGRSSCSGGGCHVDYVKWAVLGLSLSLFSSFQQFTVSGHSRLLMLIV